MRIQPRTCHRQACALPLNCGPTPACLACCCGGFLLFVSHSRPQIFWRREAGENSRKSIHSSFSCTDSFAPRNILSGAAVPESSRDGLNGICLSFPLSRGPISELLSQRVLSQNASSRVAPSFEISATSVVGAIQRAIIYWLCAGNIFLTSCCNGQSRGADLMRRVWRQRTTGFPFPPRRV